MASGGRSSVSVNLAIYHTDRLVDSGGGRGRHIFCASIDKNFYMLQRIRICRIHEAGRGVDE